MRQARVALDAQLLMRGQARQMIMGACEISAGLAVVPATAMVMAQIHYAKVSRRHIERGILSEAGLTGKTLSSEELGRLMHEGAERVTNGFAAWLELEHSRNDRILEIAPRSDLACRLAGEIQAAGVVEDQADTRWGLGEDPYIIGEALAAGAHWVASENLATLNPGKMELWLDEVQHGGRLTHVPRPFILDAETAIDRMLSSTPGWEHETGRGPEQRASLAQALADPGNDERTLDERVEGAAKLGERLAQAGLGMTAAYVRQWSERARGALKGGREEEVWNELRTMRSHVHVADVTRTRASEGRRRAEESRPERPQTRRRGWGVPAL